MKRLFLFLRPSRPPLHSLLLATGSLLSTSDLNDTELIGAPILLSEFLQALRLILITCLRQGSTSVRQTLMLSRWPISTLTNAAAPFNFQFTNAPLTFNDVGITGAQTDTTVNLTDTNAPTFTNLVFFAGGSANSGSATLNVTNIGTATGGDSRRQ